VGIGAKNAELPAYVFIIEHIANVVFATVSKDVDKAPLKN
jgi:hypothetical protein